MPLFEWYKARFAMKIGHLTNVCYDEIGLYVVKMYTPI